LQMNLGFYNCPDYLSFLPLGLEYDN